MKVRPRTCIVATRFVPLWQGLVWICGIFGIVELVACLELSLKSIVQEEITNIIIRIVFFLKKTTSSIE